MTFRIPSEDRRVSQTNISDVSGNIFATRNIDLGEQGYIKLSDGVISIYSETQDADFEQIQSMTHGRSLYFLGDDLFSTSTIELVPTMVNNTATDTTPPSPGAEEDGVFFNGREVVSDGTAIKYNSDTPGTWTTISGTTAPATGEPTCMEVFPSQNSLLIGIGNTVQRINTSWAVAQTLTLPEDFRLTSIAVNGNYSYIGTRHTGSGEAMLFLWNGSNTGNDGAYGAGTFEIQSVKPYGSSVVITNSLGQLLRFNGSGFDELAALPVYYSGGDWADAQNDYGGITNRGMVVDGSDVYLSIDPIIESAYSRFIPNMPGGVWCYDPSVGLYNKHLPTNSVVLRDSDVDTADINTTTDVITVSGITVPATGAPVHYKDGGTTIGGLTDETWYYTIKVTDTTFKLANSYQNALTGTAINLTSASDNNIFYFISQKDFGIFDPNDRSSILVLNNTEYDYTQVGRILFSSDAVSGSTALTRLNVTCPWVLNRGYFITPKMYAGQNVDTFNSLTLRFRPLKGEDSIVVKYRDTERLGVPVLSNSSNSSDTLGTWSSSTVFTTPASPFNQPFDLSNVEVGDEVEILSGAGAGHIAHVVSAVQSGFQWTVTIDEACPFVSASETMTYLINNWKKLDTIDYTWEQGWKTVAVDTQSAWCQFKVEMRGRQVAIEDNVVNNHPHGRATGFSGAR